MRSASIFVGAALALWLVNPAVSQQPANNFFTPRTPVFVPIDTATAMKNLNVNSAFRTPAQPKPFSLASVFPKVSMPSWPPKIANTPVLSQKNNPYQPNPILGTSPFGPNPTK
jgi:hypothetical protein